MSILVQLTAIVVLLSIDNVQSDKTSELKNHVLNSIFNGYNPNIRPPGENGTGPVVVEVNTYVRRISNLDDMKMQYDTQLTFRQSWKDERLKYDTKVNYVTLTSAEKLWLPDLFFSNELSGQFHNMLTPNVLLRIYPDGRILYSIRISLRLSCPMDLKNYPMDNQICSIVCASYGYTTDDVVFIWKNTDPVQLSKNIHLPKFTLNMFFTDYCTSKTNTGTYSCVKIDLLFQRETSFYLKNAYIPFIFMVLLSWISFWLNPRCWNIRFGLWIGVLVCSIIINVSINSVSPEVSYTKALDVWTGSCLTFIFCVLLELCLANNALTSDEILLDMKNQLTAEDTMTEKNSKRTSQLRNFSSMPLRWINKYTTKAQRIDVISRFLFPAAFAFFNFIYWITYAAKR